MTQLRNNIFLFIGLFFSISQSAAYEETTITIVGKREHSAARQACAVNALNAGIAKIGDPQASGRFLPSTLQLKSGEEVFQVVVYSNIKSSAVVVTSTTSLPCKIVLIE